VILLLDLYTDDTRKSAIISGNLSRWAQAGAFVRCFCCSRNDMLHIHMLWYTCQALFGILALTIKVGEAHTLGSLTRCGNPQT